MKCFLGLYFNIIILKQSRLKPAVSLVYFTCVRLQRTTWAVLLRTITYTIYKKPKPNLAEVTAVRKARAVVPDTICDMSHPWVHRPHDALCAG